VQDTKELDNGASKEIEKGCEKGECNTNEAKSITTKQEKESMRSPKPEDSTQPIYETHIIVKGLGFWMFLLAIVGWLGWLLTLSIVGCS
jgi:hypothetical protein